MGCLKIHLLGSFLVSLDGQQISQYPTEKTKALLAYLVSESDRPLQRGFLAEMMWPERPTGAARANLRHALGDLRLLLRDRPPIGEPITSTPFLLVTRDTIQLNRVANVWVDTIAFEESLKGIAKSNSLRISQLEEAVGLYRGSFLDDLIVGDSDVFHEWALLRRERYYREVLTALSKLIDCYHLWGKYEKALQHAWHYVDLAPWNEEAHQNVMRLLVFTGQRAASLVQFETCRRFLMEELGVEPGLETIKLYEQIRDGKLLEIKVSPALTGEVDVDLQPPRFFQDAQEEI
jgi:DNA-binding SARP family transcriptional activator